MNKSQDCISNMIEISKKVNKAYTISHTIYFDFYYEIGRNLHFYSLLGAHNVLDVCFKNAPTPIF